MSTVPRRAIQQTHFAPEGEARGRLRLVASADGSDGSVAIHQDARMYAALLDGAETASHALAAGRRAYVHVARGSLRVNATSLSAGDALMISGEPTVVLDGANAAEVLLFDLA